MRVPFFAILLIWSLSSVAQQQAGNSFPVIREITPKQARNNDFISTRDSSSISCTNHTDFSYRQNICDPFSVLFNAPIANTASIKWFFGDGASATAVNSVTHSFASSGLYNITLIQDVGCCIDTVIKTINISVETNPLLISNQNTTICKGSSLNLNSQDAVSYCWSPQTGLNFDTIKNPVVTPLSTTTYYLNALRIGSNIVVNGDFENGNAGFTTAYTYNPNSGFDAGVYTVGSVPNPWHPSMPFCHDHTTGSGKMMMVNGANIDNQIVWSETLNVVPNTSYAFSTWLQHITTVNPAKLQFAINGQNLGEIFNASSTSCVWKQFYTTWNSGSASVAIISIVNKNLDFSGNDFALDDIVFAPITFLRDSIIITVDDSKVVANADPNICSGESTTLTASGSFTYNWSPSTGLSNPNAAVTQASPVVTQQYIITGTSANNCITKDTVVVNVKPAPIVVTSNNMQICEGASATFTTSGAQSYSWSPAAGLNNPTIANPTFSGSSGNYTYFVTGIAANGCVGKDTVQISVNPFPHLQSIIDTSICAQTPLTLTTNTNANSISWTPANLVSNPNIASPLFTGTGNAVLFVSATNSFGCIAKDTVNVNFKPSPDVITRSDTAACGAATFTLNTGGAQTYSWTPATNLSNANIANPVFSASTGSYTYYVTGTGTNGCTAKDTLHIQLNAPPQLQSLPDIGVCKNSPLTLLTNSSAISFEWFPANLVNDPTVMSPLFTGDATATLIVAGTNNIGCVAKDTVNITVKSLPVLETLADTTLCNNNSVTLFTTGGNTWSWSPAANLDNSTAQSPIFTATGDGNYRYVVTGTNNEQCSAMDTVNITVQSGASFIAPPNATVCKGSAVVLSGSNGTNATYTWSPSQTLNDATAVNPVATPLATQTYHVNITEPLCNISRDFDVLVTVNALPDVIAQKTNDVYCGMATTKLSATGAKNYVWSPAALLNTTVSNVVTAKPQATTTFLVSGTDANGCINTDSINVVVENIGFGYFVPNSFTPNNDGINDCFNVKNWGITKDFRLMIYDRFGNQVFMATRPEACWNGMYKGQPADAGAYVYFISGENNCGKIVKKGSVLLIR